MRAVFNDELAVDQDRVQAHGVLARVVIGGRVGELVSVEQNQIGPPSRLDGSPASRLPRATRAAIEATRANAVCIAAEVVPLLPGTTRSTGRP